MILTFSMKVDVEKAAKLFQFGKRKRKRYIYGLVVDFHSMTEQIKKTFLEKYLIFIYN